MRVELSSLFGLDYASDMVKDIHIGDGVYLQEIKTNGWLDEICQRIKGQDEEQYQRLVFREKLEWHPYTHRFYVSLDEANDLDDAKLKNAQQHTRRAIVLSRIVRPTPIPLHGTLILTFHPDTGESYHLVEINVGFYGTAYTSALSPDSTITQNDAAQIAKYWPALQHFYHHELSYRRIVRALKFFNDAYHVDPAHLRHITFHAALESLVCAGSRNNKRQITKRLPQLIRGITEEQAEAIYDFCVEVKHTAAPGLLYSKEIGDLDSRDEQRVNAALWLEEALRKLFIRALDNRWFADELASPQLLEGKYSIS